MNVERLAAAPISWGICEAPGWGVQLPPERVLAEMAALGLRATELGALGWLPTDSAELRALLAHYDLSLVGGFVPLVLHDPSVRDETLAAARDAAATLAGGGGAHFVTAVVSSTSAWERPDVDADGWRSILETLTAIDDICAEHGLIQVVHPHVDTLIETADEVQRFLDGCGVSMCLDTGHLTIGGSDPAALARSHRDRIGLVHVKDVDADVAARLRSRELTLFTATQAGVFPAAGRGCVAISDTIAVLDATGYDGWYVLEQDVALSADDPLADGAGPMLAVAASIEHLRSLALTSQ